MFNQLTTGIAKEGGHQTIDHPGNKEITAGKLVKGSENYSPREWFTTNHGCLLDHLEKSWLVGNCWYPSNGGVPSCFFLKTSGKPLSPLTGLAGKSPFFHRRYIDSNGGCFIVMLVFGGEPKMQVDFC